MKARLCFVVFLLSQAGVANDMGVFRENSALDRLVLALALGAFVAIEGTVIVVEAIVYRIALPIRMRSSFGISSLANLSSIAAGAVVSIALSPQLYRMLQATDAVRLWRSIAALIVTVAIEVPIVLWWVRRLRTKDLLLEPVSDRRAVWTAAVTNLTTNGTLQFFVLFWWTGSVG